mgnify:CR=1 FL=1
MDGWTDGLENGDQRHISVISVISHQSSVISHQSSVISVLTKLGKAQTGDEAVLEQ